MGNNDLVQLKSLFKDGYILFPEDEGFEDTLLRWSAISVRPAAAVCLPKTSEDVATMVKFLTQHKIAFNVKGGGHSTAGMSSAPSPEGVVLDLSDMRKVSVDPENRTVTFDGGCLWSDIDDALVKHGLATPGGTVNHTGVGGLILHGGYGVLTGIHGLAIDNLISCEVVLADGTIVTASETENPDLFWALRGAGSSFGVVTSFTSKAHPQGDVYSGLLAFLPDKLPVLVDFLNHWDATNDGTQVMVLSATHAPVEPGQEPPPGGRPPIVVVIFGDFGPNAETAGPAYFEPLLKLKDEALISKVGMVPYPAVNTVGGEHFKHGGRYLFGGSNFTLPTKTETVQETFDLFWSMSPPSKGLGGTIISLEGIPGTALRKVPVSSTAFNNRGQYYIFALVWSWSDEARDGEMRELNQKFLTAVRKNGYDDEKAKDGVGFYANYANEAMKAETAFGGHTEKLRELKRKYDPENVFNKLWKLMDVKENGYVA